MSIYIYRVTLFRIIVFEEFIEQILSKIIPYVCSQILPIYAHNNPNINQDCSHVCIFDSWQEIAIILKIMWVPLDVINTFTCACENIEFLSFMILFLNSTISLSTISNKILYYSHIIFEFYSIQSGLLFSYSLTNFRLFKVVAR